MSSTADSLARIPYVPNQAIDLQNYDDIAEKYRPAIMRAFLDIHIIKQQEGLFSKPVKPGESRSEYARRVLDRMMCKYPLGMIYRLYEIGSPNENEYSPNTVLPLALIAKCIVTGSYKDKEREFLDLIWRLCFSGAPDRSLNTTLVASTKWPQSYFPGEVWERGVGRIA